jgi:hypothetical protein
MICPATSVFGLLFLFAGFLSGGATFSQSEQVTIRATSPLVLVDVIARNKETGASIDHLIGDDLKLTDDSIQVPVFAFDRSPRPITLWFVMICNQSNWFNEGSTFFAGKSYRLRPALEHLNADDRIAVAHWCDNGCATIDLPPTSNRDAALAAIENVLRRPANLPVGYGSGVFALQQMMRLISDITHTTKPRPTPVITFIHGDAMGMRQDYAQVVTEQLFEMSGIVYGINNGRYNGFWDRGSGQQRLAQFWSTETGGQLFATSKADYGGALEKIIQEAHARYQLGFVPQNLDGRWHRLRLELSDQAKERFRSISLRYRSGYKATAEEAPSTGLAMLAAEAVPPPDNAKADTSKPARIRFGADVRSRSSVLHAATILLGIDSSTLNWSKQLGNPEQSLMTLVVTFLSGDNQNLGYQVRNIELTRPKDEGERSKGALMRLSFSVDLSPDTKKVRLVVQDTESGRIGAIEVPRTVINR